MTRINPDDPKWTAYILGELDDAERASVELELESSEEARMLVEELRFAADFAKSELRAGGAIAPLTAQERERIYASAVANSVVRPRRWFGARPAVWAAGFAAASIALMVALSPLLLRSPRSSITETVNSAPSVTIAEAKKTEELVPPVSAPEQPKPASEFEFRYAHPALREPLAPPAAMPQTAAPGIVQSPAVESKESVPAAAPARVYGKVQDASNAVIPGVTVVATNTQTGAAAAAVTNESGAYALDGLQPGTYKVTGALPGFQTSVDSVQVAANAPAEKDIKLKVASMSQSPEVTVAADTSLSTSSNSVGRISPEVKVSDLPAAGRGPGDGGAAGGQRGGGGRGGAVRSADVQGQQGQQSPQAAAESARGGAPSGVLGGVLSGPIAQQAFAAPVTPAPPPQPLTGRFELPPAPGVPPAFDRIASPYYNGAEAYAGITDNPFLSVGQNPLSTFSIDVDTASYSNVRRFLNQGQMPTRDAVRIEEMINYFTYDYPQPTGNNPIGVTLEAASTPWNPQHRLVRVGIKAKDIGTQRRPPTNLVFLLDVSGSMQPQERLPLLKDGIHMLVQQLTANDRVTIVTYAGTTGIALQPTRGDQKDVILRLVDSLQAGGSTNGGSGIQLAYQQAASNFIPGGVNRIILATDGDFNVGITDRNALLRLIEEKAKTGVFLTVLGVGMGNYKDATLEMLADKGHGNYAYLDTLNEARKVLVDQMSSTFITVAKDVKVQVEFNPAVVDAYRLIGYENRALRNEDFNNDLKDAGDMGAGHTVTALYEVVPRGVAINAPSINPLKYQQPSIPSQAANVSNETLTVAIRYKEPTASDSKLLVFPLVDREQTFARSAPDFRFAAAVASFGMLLRDSPYKGTATMDSVLAIAEDSIGSDRNGYRREFMQLVQRARQVRGR